MEDHCAHQEDPARVQAWELSGAGRVVATEKYGGPAKLPLLRSGGPGNRYEVSKALAIGTLDPMNRVSLHEWLLREPKAADRRVRGRSRINGQDRPQSGPGAADQGSKYPRVFKGLLPAVAPRQLHGRRGRCIMRPEQYCHEKPTFEGAG